MFTSAHDSLYTTAVTKKKMLEQEYMISSWSVADCVSLLASKSKLIYRSLIFDDELALICLLT